MYFRKNHLFSINSIIVMVWAYTAAFWAGGAVYGADESNATKGMRNVSRMQNVFDHGAFGDGQSHKLGTIYKTQGEIDKKYGTGRYKLSDEMDFVAISEAIKAARDGAKEYAAKKAFKSGDTECVVNAQTVYMPAGVYLVNRTIRLMDLYGFTLKGDGHTQTSIVFNEPNDLFFIDHSGFMWFREFQVESKVASKSTAFHFEDFGATYPGAPTFKFMFDSVGMQWLYRGVQITGDVMACEIAWMKCRFSGCLTGLHVQNAQALNFNFFACDFEAAGPESHFAPFKPSDTVFLNIEAGGMVNVFGGSIIHQGTTLLLNPRPELVPKGSSAIDIGSGMFNFYGVRWEQMDQKRPYLFDRIGPDKFKAKINFDNCILYQLAKGRNGDWGLLTGGMDVTLRNCFVNFGQIRGAVEEKGKQGGGSLIIDNCEGLKYVEDANNTKAGGLSHRVKFLNRKNASN